MNQNQNFLHHDAAATAMPQFLAHSSGIKVSHNWFYYTSKPECAIPDDKGIKTSSSMAQPQQPCLNS
jgi:hypothetical protein